MLNSADMGVAFHGKAILKQATKHHLDNTDLRGLAYYLGLPVHQFPEQPFHFDQHFLQETEIKKFVSLGEFLKE
jgi:hypothetical protein